MNETIENDLTSEDTKDIMSNYLNDSICRLSKDESIHHVKLEEILNANNEQSSQSAENEEDKVSHVFKMLQEGTNGSNQIKAVSRIRILKPVNKCLSAQANQMPHDMLNSSKCRDITKIEKPLIIRSLKKDEKTTEYIIRKCIKNSSSTLRNKAITPSKNYNIYSAGSHKYKNRDDILNFSLYSNSNKKLTKPKSPLIRRHRALISIYNCSSKKTCALHNHSATQSKRSSLLKTITN
jgi:rubrerythrin